MNVCSGAQSRFSPVERSHSRKMLLLSSRHLIFGGTGSKNLKALNVLLTHVCINDIHFTTAETVSQQKTDVELNCLNPFFFK